MEDPFLSIRHYNEREVRFAWKYLIENDEFRSALKLVAPDKPIEFFEEKFQNFQSTSDFQLEISKIFVEACIKKSISKLTFRGVENVGDQPCIFIGNHRDIVLDTALLQYYFFTNGRNSSKIAFGDNLIASPLLDIIAKCNKLFIVKRGGTIREKLNNSKILSDYIHHSLFTEKESVWIAQRNGRTKNGIDRTQQGLLKMFTECRPVAESLSLLKSMNIVPVSISYQYESCDQLKARELAISEQGPYVKQPGEDVASMKQGIFGFKGEVTLTIGTPIVDEIDAISTDLKPNDQIYEVCKLINQQIYQNYYLYHTNFIACDLLDRNQRFADKYTEEQKQDFLQYIDKQSIVKDVPKEKMMDYLLQIYANPVKSAYKIPYSAPFEAENN